MNTPHIALNRDSGGVGKLVWIGILIPACVCMLSLSVIQYIKFNLETSAFLFGGGVGCGVIAAIVFWWWLRCTQEELHRQHTENLPTIKAMGQRLELARVHASCPPENIPLMMHDGPTVLYDENRYHQLEMWLEVSPKMRIPWNWVVSEYLAWAKGSDTLPATGSWSEGSRHPGTGIEYRVYSEAMKEYLQKHNLASWVPWNQKVPIKDSVALFGFFGLKEEDYE